MSDEMPEPYAYLVVFDLGTGEASTFWALDVTREEDELVMHGYRGDTASLTWATPFLIKEKPRAETPNYVIAEVEECDVSEVEKGGS